MDTRRIRRELQEHLPFSIFFTAAGIVLAALLTYQDLANGICPRPPAEHRHGDVHDHQAEVGEGVSQGQTGALEHRDEPSPRGEEQLRVASRMLFHVMHPVHLLLSAMATTAMFFRYERKVVKAAIIGLIGAVGVCGLSDIFMPYLCGLWLKTTEMHFHWCLIEHPSMVLPFVVLGIVSGLMAAATVNRSTMFSHSAHVLVSCVASLFYLISFGVPDWFTEAKLPYTFAIVVLCVTIPCCLSDILFPLLVVGGHDHEEGDCGHAHP